VSIGKTTKHKKATQDRFWKKMLADVNSELEKERKRVADLERSTRIIQGKIGCRVRLFQKSFVSQRRVSALPSCCPAPSVRGGYNWHMAEKRKKYS